MQVALAPHLASLDIDELIQISLKNVKELVGCKVPYPTSAADWC